MQDATMYTTTYSYRKTAELKEFTMHMTLTEKRK